jgi:molecular chaperone GrpE
MSTDESLDALPTDTVNDTHASQPSGANDDVADIPVEIDEIAEISGPAAGTANIIADLEAKLAAAEKDKKDNHDKYLRAAADTENQRKRSRRDVEDAKHDTRVKVLKEMLPVVDNLERAVEHAGTQSGAEAGQEASMVEGLRLVLRQFATAFERLEVTTIVAEGHAFDPNLHEAISQQESDTAAPGTVLTVLQRGYKAGDKLLRPALVVVAKAKS